MSIQSISSSQATLYQSSQHTGSLAQQRIEDEVVKVQQSHVVISDKAYHLSQSPASNTPSASSSPSVPGYGQYRKNAKALATYNVVSGLNDGQLSGLEAYAVKNNDELRSMYVGKEALEHQKEVVDSFIEQSQSQESDV